MYIKNVPPSITNFLFVIDDDKQISKDSWLKITRINNIGNENKEIQQKVIRISPEDQGILYSMLKEKFDG